MATRKTTVTAQNTPAPIVEIESTSTEPVTLSDLPPAETFQGLVAYGVDTNTDQSVQIPLEFVAQGAQAAVDAAGAASTATEHAKAATTATQEATTAANTAAEAANTAAADLEQLKTDCADATTAANTATAASTKQTAAAKTATTAANTAAGVANTKAGEASAATQAAKAAATRATEAAQNLTDDVAALVPYVGENLILKSLDDTHHSTYLPWCVILSSSIDSSKLEIGNVVNLHMNSSILNNIFCLLHYTDSTNDVVYPGDKITLKKIPKSIEVITGDRASRGRLPFTDFSIDSIKLEVGPKATPYLPNPADIARAIDYSLLTEQVVPGEFWLGLDGVSKKQVYTRSFYGTLPSSLSSNADFVLATMIYNRCTVMPSSMIGGWPPSFQTLNGGVNTVWGLDTANGTNIKVAFLTQTPSSAWINLGLSKYFITIKYTK